MTSLPHPSFFSGCKLKKMEFSGQRCYQASRLENICPETFGQNISWNFELVGLQQKSAVIGYNL